MGNGMYMALSGAVVQEKRLNTVSNNLANSNSMAFKSDDLIFKDYMNNAEKNYNSPDKVIPASFVQVASKVTDFSQGPLTHTGNEFDIAIDGKGFFLVENGEGLQVTRNGSMKLGEGGILLTQDGYKVMGLKNRTEYAPIELAKKGEIIFSSDGNVFVRENGKLSDVKSLVGKMAIVDFKDLSQLEKVKGGYYKIKDPEQIDIPETLPLIKQGFQEKSNVNIIEEMTQLISLTRNFESNQRVIQAIDQMDSQSVEKLGSV